MRPKRAMTRSSAPRQVYARETAEARDVLRARAAVHAWDAAEARECKRPRNRAGSPWHLARQSHDRLGGTMRGERKHVGERPRNGPARVLAPGTSFARPHDRLGGTVHGELGIALDCLGEPFGPECHGVGPASGMALPGPPVNVQARWKSTCAEREVAALERAHVLQATRVDRGGSIGYSTRMGRLIPGSGSFRRGRDAMGQLGSETMDPANVPIGVAW